MDAADPTAPGWESFPGAVRWTGYLLALMFLLLVFTFEGVRAEALLSDGFAVGLAVNAPFVGAIVYGGRWLERSALSPDRYPRLAKWFGGGLVGFLSINVVMVLVWPAESLYNNLAWVYFAANVGGAVGLGVGLFEARALERAVVAERRRQKNQKITRRNEQLDQFASVVSHDLRNPLNVAYGNLELARSECDSEHLDSATKSLERMEGLIDDLLELARSGRQIESVDPVNLGSVASHSWTNVETADATLEVHVDREIRADSGRLQQLLENLSRNAVEHGSKIPPSQAREEAVEHGPAKTREDTVERRDVTVTVGELDDGFYVEDDGPGIPPTERETVFEAGYSSADDGAGLGLNIVKQVVDAHGWDVRVTDGADGGARFEITGVDFVDDERDRASHR